jgi:hypothetical protein
VAARADKGHVTELIRNSERIFYLRKITAICFDNEAGCSTADSSGFLRPLQANTGTTAGTLRYVMTTSTSLPNIQNNSTIRPFRKFAS